MTLLQQAREKMGLTQEALAALAGVHQSEVSRMERSSKGTSVNFAAKVVPHLGGHVTEMDLLYPSRAEGDEDQAA